MAKQKKRRPCWWGIKCYDRMEPENDGWVFGPSENEEQARRVYDELRQLEDGIVSYELQSVPVSLIAR